MKKRSKQNNPEQKTRNGVNNEDVELGVDYDPVKQSKKKYEKPVDSVLSQSSIPNRNNHNKSETKGQRRKPKKFLLLFFALEFVCLRF